MPAPRWSRPVLLFALLLTLLAGGASPPHLFAQKGSGGGKPGADGAPISGSPAVPQVQTEPLMPVALPSAASPASGAAPITKGAAATTDAAVAAAAVTPLVNPTLDMRVLVISADGTESSLGVITQSLDYLGVPYTSWIATNNLGQLTADRLFSGTHGYYYAVLLATSNLAYTPDNGATWLSGLSASEWQALWDYETAFQVRQVTWYTFPTAEYGFTAYTATDTTNTALNASLTAAGRQVFPYLSSTAIPIRHAYTYRGTAAAASTGVQVLVRDPSGKALALVKTYPDGRQNLAVTFAGNPYLVHSLAYSYGLVNWATRGIFLGQRQIYMSPQADDYFIEDDVWTTTTPCGTNLDLNPSGVTFRMARPDLAATYRWQNSRRNQAITRGLRIAMAFNGVGADPESAGGTMPANDTLVAATNSYKGSFFWINHTYEHPLLNDQNIPQDEFLRQLTLNDNVATRLQLPNYDRGNMVTPEISGLENPVFLGVASQFGIRYLVSDTSRAGMSNPSPNVGYANALQGDIYMIPRRPNNLFYNVTKPAEWVAEYNCLYESFWGAKLTYNQILDKESDMLLQYLLRGDIDPWMFHVTNLRAYQGSGTNKTLLGDLIDATVTKYQKIYNLPISSLAQEVIGQMMKDRYAYNQAGVAGTISGKQVTITAQGAAKVPLTGACYSNPSLGISQTSYGGQCVATVPVAAGSQVSFSLP